MTFDLTNKQKSWQYVKNTLKKILTNNINTQQSTNIEITKTTKKRKENNRNDQNNTDGFV